MNEVIMVMTGQSKQVKKMKKFILSGDYKQLINYQSQGKEFNLAVPTPEHFSAITIHLSFERRKRRCNFVQ
ncbi:MAG: hypothetical protein MZV64_57535 [Ignavibacteriales bacterium]|nr:hypothetical protein [Ignavibacteriales bacterium]